MEEMARLREEIQAHTWEPKRGGHLYDCSRSAKFVPVDITTADYGRMAELVELYADWPLGGTDASVIAIAERLGVTTVATLDRRHFGPTRPRHIEAFTLLPETL
jgi:predicted nucleic acid-binding protein